MVCAWAAACWETHNDSPIANPLKGEGVCPLHPVSLAKPSPSPGLRRHNPTGPPANWLRESLSRPRFSSSVLVCAYFDARVASHERSSRPRLWRAAARGGSLFLCDTLNRTNQQSRLPPPFVPLLPPSDCVCSRPTFPPPRARCSNRSKPGKKVRSAVCARVRARTGAWGFGRLHAASPSPSLSTFLSSRRKKK